MRTVILCMGKGEIVEGREEEKAKTIFYERR